MNAGRAAGLLLCGLVSALIPPALALTPAWHGAHTLLARPAASMRVQEDVRPDRDETERRAEPRGADAERHQTDIAQSRARERAAEGRDVRREEDTTGRTRAGEADHSEQTARPDRGFADHDRLDDHWSRHGQDFGARTPEEYELQARRFLNGPRGEETLERQRPDGDVIRFNERTNEFGVVAADGTVRTYFRPDPAQHGYATNLDYFNAQH